MSHTCFSHSPTDGHLGCSHILVIVTNAAMKLVYFIFFWISFRFLWTDSQKWNCWITIGAYLLSLDFILFHYSKVESLTSAIIFNYMNVQFKFPSNCHFQYIILVWVCSIDIHFYDRYKHINSFHIMTCINYVWVWINYKYELNTNLNKK